MNIEDKKLQIANEGYTIIENILSQKECDHYIQILEECYDKFYSKYAQPYSRSKHGLENKENEKIVHNLHNKHVSFLKLLDHPMILPLVSDQLQKGSYNDAEPFIHAANAGRTPIKNAPPQQLHIDSRLPGSPFPLVIQVMFCLEDFTKESGATRVVPGSHLLQMYPENGKVYPEEIVLCASKGSALIFNAGLWHGSSAKKTDQTRWSIVYRYARWFMKPSTDFNKNMPQALYNKLSDYQKELLGYKFNPPQDEFTRTSARSEVFEEPEPYLLPK